MIRDASASSVTEQLGSFAGEVMPALRLRNVTKSFGGTTALRGVSFDIARGSVHALCGGNGSGKSTLIKILAGVHQADSGTIDIDGESHSAGKVSPTLAAACGLHFVHQAVGTFADLTVAENFALGSTFGTSLLRPVSWRGLNRRVGEVLTRFELDVSPTAKMGELRPATRTMVAVARALQDEQQPGEGILVLDEPTAALPAHEAEAVLGAIRGYARRGHTVVFVTHRLPELLQVATEATFLRDGEHLETRPVTGLDERGLVERIAGHALVTPTLSNRGRARDETGGVLLDNYAVGPVSGAHLTVASGEVVGISGLLGSGRSALLQGLFGARRATGTAVLDGRPLNPRSPAEAISRGVAYLPEDRTGQAAFPDLTLRENLTAPCLGRYWRKARLSRPAERSDARGDIERYGVVASSPEAALSSLSGGNQQKVVLARWLRMRPRLLLLDEPTQGVDVGARAAIHALIKEVAAVGTSVLVVSSDPAELAELCDRVVGLWQGRIRGEAVGSALTPQLCSELAYGLGETDPSSTEVKEGPA